MTSYSTKLTAYLYIIIIKSAVVLCIICSKEFVKRHIDGHSDRCCKIVYCEPGKEILTCTEPYQPEVCSNCTPGTVQPLYISSKDNERSCFKPKSDDCNDGEKIPVRTARGDCYPKYCACDTYHCLYDAHCVCVQHDGCPENHTLYMNGSCMRCSENTYRPGLGCGPCVKIPDVDKSIGIANTNYKITLPSKGSTTTRVTKLQTTTQNTTTEDDSTTKGSKVINTTNTMAKTSTVKSGTQFMTNVTINPAGEVFTMDKNHTSNKTSPNTLLIIGILAAAAAVVVVFVIVITIIILRFRRRTVTDTATITKVKEEMEPLNNNNTTLRVDLPDTSSDSTSERNIKNSATSLLPIDSAEYQSSDNPTCIVTQPSDSEGKGQSYQYNSVVKSNNYSYGSIPTAAILPIKSMPSMTSESTMSIPSNPRSYDPSFREPVENADTSSEDKSTSQHTEPKLTFENCNG